jgi:hypothetical protein
MDEIWTGLYPTLAVAGACIAISTPRGAQGWFHKF